MIAPLTPAGATLRVRPPRRLVLLFAPVIVLASSIPLHAQGLKVDFNSTNLDGGPHNEAGYQPYDAGHEVTADFAAARSYPAFGATVTLAIDWPDTTDNRVRQMIDRGPANDGNYFGNKLDLMTDWVGIDTRTGNGGNGSGITSMRFTLGGLPAGAYRYRAYHHDTEFVNAEFDLAVDDADGARELGHFHMTASSPGGSVNDNRANPGTGNDPDVLSSTVEAAFRSDGASPVVITYRVRGGANADNQIFGVNGFEIDPAAPPTAPTDVSLDGEAVSADAPAGTLVGTFTTSDPEPGDSFTYALVDGTGDEDNGLFRLGGVDGEELRTAAVLTGMGGARLSIRVRTTDAGGSSLEGTFVILVTNDADADGLDDDWERRWFGDLAAASGDGDNDGDGLVNTAEQSRGTRPDLADTDGDGLGDAVETGTGTFTDPADTGSDPLRADTDGDGLADGDEVAGSGGATTDPNRADTDEDGFPDPLELAEGTDPDNPLDFPDTLLPLRLNEIVANNADGLRDGFGDTSDWIEIHNPNDQPVNLDGHFLTNDAEEPAQWNFPPVTVPAGGYLVVFASGRDTTDPASNLHTNFRLDAKGEFLAIVRPDGRTPDDALTPAFPAQFPDLSYGRRPSDGSLRFFDTPTPGAANGTGYAEVVADTKFSVDRGFHDTPFEVAITSATPGAEIRYTLDGTRPSPTGGTIYTGPIPVTTTTTLRAMAWKPDALATDVDTHTYVFLDDVAEQPADPAGWPANWGTDSEVPGVVVSDYEMDARVVGGTIPEYGIRDALLDLPTLSIVLPLDDFIGPTRGIYTHPKSRGAAWEREASLELIHPDGTPGFQEDCIVEIHGNSSRRPWRMQKHSLRVTFRAELGAGKLDYPLFPDSPVDEFNQLVLRACFTDSWGLVSWGADRYRPNDSQYFRDVWMKESFRAMGQGSSHGDFAHLYVNGLYWGIVNHSERLADDFFADHFGGEPSDWEINEDLSSPGARWNAMMRIDASTPEGYNEILGYVDAANFADYMLLHFYGDAEDWPHHNGYAAANVGSGDGRFRFFVWDQEIVLDKHGLAAARINDSRGAGALFQKLRRNDEFRLLFADRVRRHLFHGGALTAEASAARYLDIAARIDKAIVAESARWGDTQRSTPYGNTIQQPSPLTNVNHDAYPPAPHGPDYYFTREDSWLVERDNVVDNYIPAIHDESNSFAIVRVLRNSNLYPDTAPAEFARHGGNVPTGFELAIEAPDGGTIYYTVDGSDPRASSAGVEPTIVELVTEEAPKRVRVPVDASEADASPNWREPAFDDASWAEGTLGAGIERSLAGAYIDLIDPNFRAPSPNDLEPQLYNVNGSLYLRTEFTLPDPPPDFARLELLMRCDDGFVAYLNGTEIDRRNALGAPPAWNATASGPTNDSEAVAFAVSDVSVHVGLLRPGRNVLAVQALNQSLSSSDMLIHPQLRGVIGSASGDPSPTAAAYVGPIPLTDSVTVRTRVRRGAEWSALTEATFIVGVPASSDNLAISEIMFNPPEGPDYEYLELLNIHPTETIDLSGVRFTDGIDFSFPLNTRLAPGERALIVADETAFTAKHGAIGRIVGTYAGRLDNGGETIVLLGQDEAVIRAFRYDDRLPWPEAADGLGASLVLVRPEANPDHAVPGNWRPSSRAGGAPGASDAVPPPADPLADRDGDGANALVEYALGTDDTVPGDTLDRTSFGLEQGTAGDGSPVTFLTIGIRVAVGADAAEAWPRFSADLLEWPEGGGDFELTGQEFHGDGTMTLVFRFMTPVEASGPRGFFRIEVVLP